MKQVTRKAMALILTLALALSCCAMIVLLSGNRAARAEEAQWSPTIEGTISPETRTGVLDAKTGFSDIVSQVGSQTQYAIRIDDGSENRGPIETYPIKTWGGRIGTAEKFYDFDSLEMEIDFTYANGTPGAPQDLWGSMATKDSIQSLELFLSSLSYGAYHGMGNALTLSVARNVDDAATADVDESTQYSFTVTAGGANGQTVVSYTGDGQNAIAIPFRGGYSGFVWTFETNVLDFKFGAEGDNYTLTVTEVANPSNSHVILMPKSTLDNVAIDGSGDVYLVYGGVSAGSGVYRFNKITCDDTKAYDESIAPMVETIKEYETVVADLQDPENIARANELRVSVSLAGFRSYDVAYWQPRLDAANALFEAGLNIDALEGLVDDLAAEIETALASASDVAALDALYEKVDEGNLFIEIAISRDQERGEALRAEFESTVASVNAKAKTIMSAYIAEFSEKSAAIDSVQAMSSVYAIRANATKYMGRLSSTDQAELNAALTAADEVFAAKNSHTGWTGSNNSLMYSNGTTVSYGAIGNGGMSSNLSNRDGSAITYTASTVAANNFTMSFTIERISTDGWISIGLMSEPNTFFSSAATDESTGLPLVQTNPGLMFLITPLANGTARVELYNIEITTNNFYNALISTITINYELGKEIELSVVAESDEADAYVSISIGGEDFPRGRIDNSMLRSSFGSDYQSYLTICQLTNTANDCYEVDLVKINGHDAASADIAKVDPLPSPDYDKDDDNDDDKDDNTDGEKGSGCGGTIVSGAAFAAILTVAAAGVVLTLKKRESDK